jgi:cell division protein FtsI (penicillin-binding protein 3)/stage V sporulation protein D (sporulation-specific penicillin-binding protein)
MAAGINEGVITASTTYGDPGVRRFGTFSVSNFDGRSYGTQTMTQVLEKSLNTGAMFAMERVGQERFFEYIKSFGFGEPTGIDVPGELAGNISNLSLGRDVDYATASFGQGIAMTPLQIAMGMAAIANDGTLMRPYIVEKLIDDSGAEEIRRPQEVRRVISPESSETLTRMLVSAVRNGFENRAGVKGYFVAGKTGTAQIPLQGRRGYSDDVIHTFVGYAPAFQPRFLVLLELVKPRGNRFAANTLTPVFHTIAQFMLNYYEVPPDER